MTSISAASTNTYQSPLQKLQDELQSEVNSGAISSSDKDALSAALTDIDSAMQANRASDQAGATRPAPGELKSKIDDLIAGEVSSGKLTSDQAVVLGAVDRLPKLTFSRARVATILSEQERVVDLFRADGTDCALQR